ncbi:MAG: protein kinase [Xanthomonadales bacterium]|nr:protein kinase [Xanthomonadales bacterium]
MSNEKPKGSTAKPSSAETGSRSAGDKAAVSADQPTQLMPDRGPREAGVGDSSEQATRILDRADTPTVVIPRKPAPDAAAEPTRVLARTPADQPKTAQGGTAQTDLSVPMARAPAAPLATSVSVPVMPIIQVPAPQTGASASPSAARTAGSAVDRDELPKTGDYIKDRFELIEELGRGGMGAVFRARDLRKTEALDPDPFVAIKFISGNLLGFDRAFVALQREAKNAQALNHPNIVKVFDFDRDGDLVYLTMEVVEGVALHARMRASNQNPLTPAERDHLTHGMLAGMSYAHLRDLSHADLKPSNMMIDANGDLKILDFGIARRREYDTVFDADDLFALTIDYASPEMLNRQRPTPADDVYALGCIIYAMHAGAHPFNHVRADLACSEKMRPERPKSLNRVQWQALRKSLAFTREQRFADAAQFQRAFEAPDWRKIGSIAATVLSTVLLVGWLAADPIQSWMTVSKLDGQQKIALQSSLKDGSEYVSGGYAEDAIYAYVDVLKLDSHNGTARSGINSALAMLKASMPVDEFRSYLLSQQQEAASSAWLRERFGRELADLPPR